MKNIFLLTILLSACISNCYSQNWLWAKSSGGQGYQYSRAITTDNANNIYIAGEFYLSTITFDTFTFVNSDTSAFTGDIFIAKYDSNGNVLWAKSAGGIESDVCRSVSADANGNVFITGYFRSSSIIFGSYTLYNVNNFANTFIVKYDANGNVLWAKSADGGTGNSVSADPLGNVFLTGSFGYPQISFGAITLFNADASWYSSDFFIAKYDANGNVLWAKSAGMSGKYRDDIGTSVSADANGNVFVTGYFRSPSITFDSTTLINAGGVSMSGLFDLFIVKYDSNGNILWAKSEGGDSDDFGSSISADPTGNVFITGKFGSSSITFGSNILTNSSSGNYNMFIAKYDANGNILWAKGASGSGGGLRLATDLAGNVFVTGSFEDSSITFGSLTVNEPVGANYPIFIVKYSASGNELCASTLACGGFDGALTVDALGSAYITGMFDMNPFIVGTDTLTLTGVENVFVAKFSCSNTNAMNELNHEENISVFPNPSSGIFSLNLKNKTADAKICVYDLLGNCVLSNITVKELNQKIDLGSQPSGVYFVQMIFEDETTTRKIIIK